MSSDVATNKYNVPKRQWKKWTAVARQVFNKNYGFALEAQEVFCHPDTVRKGGIPKDEWNTICWNLSFYAADICSRGEKNFLKGYEE